MYFLVVVASYSCQYQCDGLPGKARLCNSLFYV